MGPRGWVILTFAASLLGGHEGLAWGSSVEEEVGFRESEPYYFYTLCFHLDCSN